MKREGDFPSSRNGESPCLFDARKAIGFSPSLQPTPLPNSPPAAQIAKKMKAISRTLLGEPMLLARIFFPRTIFFWV